MEILSSGDFVNELLILVSGRCEAMTPGSLGPGECLALGDAYNQQPHSCATWLARLHMHRLHIAQGLPSAAQLLQAAVPLVCPAWLTQQCPLYVCLSPEAGAEKMPATSTPHVDLASTDKSVSGAVLQRA